MKSHYKSTENTAAWDLFTALYLGSITILMTITMIWYMIIGKANLGSASGGFIMALLSLVTAIFFFREYRDEKRERAEEEVKTSAHEG